MRKSFVLVAAAAALLPVRHCFCQSAPPPERAEDLAALVEAAGFGRPMYPNRCLENYLRFGDVATEKKVVRGDQFDRLEARKAAAPRLAELRQRRFVLRGFMAQVSKNDDVETKGLTVTIDLPLRVRGDKPFFQDGASLSGAIAAVHASTIDVRQYWFLTKDNGLRPCTWEEADIVRRNNGTLYHPERPATSLFLNFKGDLGSLKTIARNFRAHTVEIQLADLALERPDTWGYFRRDVYFEKDLDTERLVEEELKAFANPQPNYFVTAHLHDHETEKRIPEVVSARLTALRVLDPDGKAVGGYKAAAWLPEAPPPLRPPAAKPAEGEKATGGGHVSTSEKKASEPTAKRVQDAGEKAGDGGKTSRDPSKNSPATAKKAEVRKKEKKKAEDDESIESFKLLRISGRGERARAFVKLLPSNRTFFVSAGQKVGGWRIESVDVDTETVVATDPMGDRKRIRAGD